MPRLKPKALSNPPSQPGLEGGLDSAPQLTPNTVAAVAGFIVGLTKVRNSAL